MNLTADFEVFEKSHEAVHKFLRRHFVMRYAKLHQMLREVGLCDHNKDGLLLGDLETEADKVEPVGSFIDCELLSPPEWKYV